MRLPAEAHEVVGQRSGYMLSQKPESNTETLLSPPAELTSITPDTGIEHNSIAGLTALYSASDFKPLLRPRHCPEREAWAA